MDPCLLSIVGNKRDSHIGNQLSLAAETLKIKHELIDTNNAFIGILNIFENSSRKGNK